MLANPVQQQAYETTITGTQDVGIRHPQPLRANALLEVDSIAPSREVIKQSGLQIDLLRHQAYADGKKLNLTPTEFRLLECFLRQPGRAFSRSQLLDAAIAKGGFVLARTIDVHIKTLRRKLGPSRGLIETVRGFGYRFCDGRD